jgi:hypothetical protein
MPTIKLKRGLRANLPSAGSAGEAFFCYDTGELFIANNAGSMVEINAYESNYAEKLYTDDKAKSYSAESFIKVNDQKTLNAVSLARIGLIGGGTISISSDVRIKWTTRIVALGMGKGAHFSTDGYFQIAMPSAGNTITKYGGGTATVDTNGIPLNTWETLYYLLPIGQSSASSLSNFVIYPYNVTQEIPDNAVMIAMRSGDSSYVYLFNKTRLGFGASTTY